MLDEAEYARVVEAYHWSTELIKRLRAAGELTLEEAAPGPIYFRVRQLYEAMTGETLVDHDEILKHRLSSLGPACRQCGKPLRSPDAAFCAECGLKRDGT